jgi:hydrogenase maturation protease
MNCLVLGYGNTLRSDDGAGQIVAQQVTQWNLPGVRSLCLHQLTPELAADIAEVELVIFVDAYPASAIQEVQVCSLESSSPNTLRSHTSDPRILLNLTQTLYNHCPQAWWILIPGEDFALGEHLSSITKCSITRALEQIKLLLSHHLSDTDLLSFSPQLQK